MAQIEAAKKRAPEAREAAAPKAKPETWMKRAYQGINVVRTLAWLVGAIVAIGVWVAAGFQMPSF